MRGSAKSLGLRIAGAVQDAGRLTGSVLKHAAPLPGFAEVSGAAMRLVDGLEDMESHMARRKILSSRITSILALLEPYCSAGEISSELQYFYNKLSICQRQVCRLDSSRGLSNALRASRELDVIERLEREVDANLQDAIFTLLLQRLSAPSETVILELDTKTPKEACSAQPYNYPRIKRCQINVGAIIRRARIDFGEGSATRSIAKGKYRNQEVLVVQYSSKLTPDRAAKAFLSAITIVIQEQHPNVLRFMGASEDISSCENYYMVFETGQIVSRELFVQTLRSARAAFNFLGGVKSGMQFLLDHGVQSWSDIHVAEGDRAVVCPPYWGNSNAWEKSNHDVFSCLTGTTGSPDFPLSTLSEILNISGDRWPEFESAISTRTTELRDYHLMQIAETLDLPVPPFLLVYCGPLPDFLISVGSIGIPDWNTTGQPSDCFHGSMNSWLPISSLWTCTGWEALQTCILEYWTLGDKTSSVDDDGTGNIALYGTSPNMAAFPPLDSSDGWLSYGCFESSDSFGVAYELAISESTLFEQSWKRFGETRLGSLVHLVEEEPAFHAVRHVSVSVHCKPGKMHGFLPLYFHRRPSAMFNVEHYWGFLSDSPDPTVAPCQLVRSIEVNYSIEINTLRANDDWKYRAEQCFESVISTTPGTFTF